MALAQVEQRVERRQNRTPQRVLPDWPIKAAFVLMPLYFLLGLQGFMWVVLAVPMLAALGQKRDLVVFKGTSWWMFFLGAALLSAVNLDTVGRVAGWTLRFGYFAAAIIYGLYMLNGGRSLRVSTIVRCLTFLWMATVVGGYLGFVFGAFSYRSPMYFVMPADLLENELINTLVTPGFADLQNIIGVELPRPKAPFAYTNTWGSMLALLTPFAVISLTEKDVGLNPTLIRVMLAASVVPAVVSLNRGLWLSLGIGCAYVAVRLGLLGSGGLLIRMMFAVGALALVLLITPLGDLIVTRIDTGHSNEGRFELVMTSVEGTAERPLLGWGAPRPNRDGLPPIGTHGQLWYLMFSHGILGAVSYCAFFASVGLRTWRQPSASGLWAHAVLIIGAVQMLFYLTMPNQLFVMMAAAAVATRVQSGTERFVSAS
ncbi:MAG: hypothetical protein HKN24_10585 [Acidimicrobiales bacterium]|nr:hypothetical protein [Acidimicrobiales bacterium]